MAITNCNSLKESLIDYLRKEVEVASFRDRCVLTLPVKTLDDRYVDVAVEQRLEDYFVVHDAGKSLNELFTQGVSLTEAKRRRFEAMARYYGAELVNDVFTIACKSSELQNAIISISQCATMAMLELMEHCPEVEEEPITDRISKALKAWQPTFVRSIDRRVQIKGTRFPHWLDFVVYPGEELEHHTTAIKWLPPSYSGQIQAERYAFLVLDIERTLYNKWRRLAVVTKVETWPLTALAMVRDLSGKTIELRSGEESSVQETLPTYMDALIA